ncbi:hypothetical protein FQN60_005519 [Etheostoma spectabile]|uniref:Uncharacterized protein n=1 Tax=Etheostoma spectabile TaxID=54343 RepID=A0A5J5CDG7_9PERO|nr:hypothetical protein FQN60_005519 [Etheostoma spectabile]
MNYLRRRLSDSSFVANLPNGYMMDLQRPTPPGSSTSSTSSPASPATERRQPPSIPTPASNPASGSGPGSSTGTGSGSAGSFLSSFSSVVKSAQLAQNVAAAAHAKSAAPAANGSSTGSSQPPKPVIRKPKILLVIDDQHTDWAKYFRGKKLNGEYEIRVEQKMLQIVVAVQLDQTFQVVFAKGQKILLTRDQTKGTCTSVTRGKSCSKTTRHVLLSTQMFISEAEFSEINLASYVNSGCMVDMQVNKGGTRVVSPFSARRCQNLQQAARLQVGTLVWLKDGSQQPKFDKPQSNVSLLYRPHRTPAPLLIPRTSRGTPLIILNTITVKQLNILRSRDFGSPDQATVQDLSHCQLALEPLGPGATTTEDPRSRPGDHDMMLGSRESFKPDFVLIRQHAYSMIPGEDFRNLVIGLHFGGVPSTNSLFSIYNFCSKPWVFSQMIKLYHSLGPEKFPLNEQTFYPNHTQMSTSQGNYDQTNIQKYQKYHTTGDAGPSLWKVAPAVMVVAMCTVAACEHSGTSLFVTVCLLHRVVTTREFDSSEIFASSTPLKLPSLLASPRWDYWSPSQAYYIVLKGVLRVRQSARAALRQLDNLQAAEDKQQADQVPRFPLIPERRTAVHIARRSGVHAHFPPLQLAGGAANQRPLSSHSSDHNETDEAFLYVSTQQQAAKETQEEAKIEKEAPPGATVNEGERPGLTHSGPVAQPTCHSS